MSIETLLWALGCVILLFAIVGLLWSRRKSKQEAEEERQRLARRARSTGIRELTAEEIQYPFGRPSAQATSRPTSTRQLHPQSERRAAPFVQPNGDEVDIDLDDIADVVQAGAVVVEVIRDAIRPESLETDGRPCDPKADAVDATGEPIKPQDSGAACYARPQQSAASADTLAEPVARSGDSGGGAIETAATGPDSTFD